MTGDIMAASSQTKHVQELSANGDEPPVRYVVKDTSLGEMTSSPPSDPIPIIDLSLLSSSVSSSKEEADELEKLKLALSSWGCFQAIGHGMSSSFLDTVRDRTKQFFALPMKEKRNYSRAVNDYEGYGNDPVLSEKQVLDWSDRLFLYLLPEDQRKYKLWPETPTDFRQIISEYCEKMSTIIDLLFKAMARSLDLEENSFSIQFGDEAKIQSRFNYYPICPRPNLVLGVKAHSDGSGITILLQDKEVEGLQLLKDDQWIRVPIIPHALVVNLGDLMQTLAKSLNLEENSFSNQIGCEPQMNARFNFYPICPRPELVLGVKAHSDGSVITVLLQDKEVEGLQVLKDDQWATVPILPDALVISTGDQMQIMSNGIFKSPLHRAVANSKKERISVAAFYVPDPEKEIKPADELIDNNRPQLYRKLKNYVAINFECCQNGKIAAIDAVKM